LEIPAAAQSPSPRIFREVGKPGRKISVAITHRNFYGPRYFNRGWKYG
jgi:hypothetical protein